MLEANGANRECLQDFEDFEKYQSFAFSEFVESGFEISSYFVTRKHCWTQSATARWIGSGNTMPSSFLALSPAD